MSEPPITPKGGSLYEGRFVAHLAYDWLTNSVRSGLSNNQAIRTLRDAGLSVGTEAARAALREIRGAFGNASGLQNTPHAFIPSEGVFYPSDRRKAGEYFVEAQIELSQPLPDGRTSLGLFHTSRRNMPQQQWLDRLVAAASAAADAYNLTLSAANVRIIRAQRGIGQ